MPAIGPRIQVSGGFDPTDNSAGDQDRPKTPKTQDGTQDPDVGWRKTKKRFAGCEAGERREKNQGLEALQQADPRSGGQSWTGMSPIPLGATISAVALLFQCRQSGVPPCKVQLVVGLVVAPGYLDRKKQQKDVVAVVVVVVVVVGRKLFTSPHLSPTPHPNTYLAIHNTEGLHSASPGTPDRTTPHLPNSTLPRTRVRLHSVACLGTRSAGRLFRQKSESPPGLGPNSLVSRRPPPFPAAVPPLPHQKFHPASPGFKIIASQAGIR
ncbi:hypothetical protein QC762_0112410 [Podospora pseudocomata]|uniref:Uncharacterized protein n=1 Tax=Podospora pseudocomata TaxID=2093779 RepID=A0ABR0G4K0_9PEZI|nr:hypothetical protein QC762_0112410 [Podospora pseudocomata]